MAAKVGIFPKNLRHRFWRTLCSVYSVRSRYSQYFLQEEFELSAHENALPVFCQLATDFVNCYVKTHRLSPLHKRQ